MKKISVLLVYVFLACLVCSSMPAFSMEVNRQTREGELQQKITEVGFKILNANKIDKRITFFYKARIPVLNAYASSRGKTVNVFKGILPFCETDDELAAVLSHEIAHNIDFYKGYWHTWAMQFTPRKYEYQADVAGADLMVNAGYNPVAMIIFMNKAFEQHGQIEEILGTHPIASKRMMRVYEHIYLNYPKYLANNSYKDNIYYQNFLLTSSKDRKKFENEVLNGPGGTVEVRYK